MTRNEFELLYALKKNGKLSYRGLSECSGASIGYISQAMKRFEENGFTNKTGITSKGINALKPYKVDNAIIMAAGMSSRFVPLSLEKPKGLLTVKGEVLIERQIEQLQSAGIEEIVIVLGYKKEAFFYLENKYEGIKFIINPEYNTKNNTHTLFLAQKYFGNTYICSSDDYFVKNPFDEYVYQSYYAAQHVTEKTNEWYMYPDKKGNISKVEKGGKAGDIMLGHAYWDKSFSSAMREYLNQYHETGEYDQDLWEQILMDKVKKLPPMMINVYPEEEIFEFDSLEDLRDFDEQYVSNTHSVIMRNICKVLKCSEDEITGFKVINKGLTNSSFIFEVRGQKYVYRHPGEGTEEIISRKHEKESLELAKAIGADPTFIYMDEKEGWKISNYVDNIRMPDYSSHDDSKRVIKVLRNLHNKKLTVDWNFLPWEEAGKIEEILRKEKGGIADREFNTLKDNVKKCYEKTINDGTEMCFCHCDTYAPNWMLTDAGDTILIDWEYAGNADPGCDTGTYIMDSMWEIEEAILFIKEYCGNNCPRFKLFHHLAYTAILSYYWYVWALYREACGAVMGDSLYNWRVMARRYSSYLTKEFEL